MEIADLERYSFARNDVCYVTKSLRGQRETSSPFSSCLYGLKNVERNSSQNELNSDCLLEAANCFALLPYGLFSSHFNAIIVNQHFSQHFVFMSSSSPSDSAACVHLRCVWRDASANYWPLARKYVVVDSAILTWTWLPIADSEPFQTLWLFSRRSNLDERLSHFLASLLPWKLDSWFVAWIMFSFVRSYRTISIQSHTHTHSINVYIVSNDTLFPIPLELRMNEKRVIKCIASRALRSVQMSVVFHFKKMKILCEDIRQ